MTESKKLFPATSMTLLQKLQSAEPQTREVSLARFCALYYPAIYGFARMRGLDVEDAKDRTQDFFVEIVRDGLLAKYDPGHGSRLSSWLMKCFKHLDLNHRAAQATIKRGGGREFVPFDSDFAEHAYGLAVGSGLPEEATTDLLMAMSLWQDATASVLQRYEGKPELGLVMEILPYTLEDKWPAQPAPTQAEIAEKHGTTLVRLKAFFNRTLKSQAQRFFNEAAFEARPGISASEIEELWQLLRAYHGR